MSETLTFPAPAIISECEDLFSTLRSAGRVYRISPTHRQVLSRAIKESRARGVSWASISRDARITPRTAHKLASM